MAKIKLHNPELAANSKFKNFVLESLNEDPTSLGTESVGRIWFNSTEKTLKAAFLNETGDGLVIKPIADSSHLASISENLAAEEAARIAADESINNRLVNLESHLYGSNINGNIGDLSTLVTDTKDTIVGAINELHQDTIDLNNYIDTNFINKTTTSTEIIAGSLKINGSEGIDVTNGLKVGGTLDVTGNTTLNSNVNVINDLSIGGDVIINGNLTVSGSQTIVETENLKVADNIITLNNGIGDVNPTENAGIEVDRGNQGITKILIWNELLDQVEVQEDGELRKVATVNYVQSEINTINSNANNLQNELDATQTGAGLNSDGTYSANSSANFISTATSLVDADNKLDAEIKRYQDQLASTTENTDGANLIGYEGYTETDTNIVNPVIEITTGTVKEAIDKIALSVNTKFNEIENKFIKGEVAAADKADTYTIAHNLDTEFVDVSVQVYDEDEQVWRFDLVVIEVIDANTIKISLASGAAAQIRYVIQGY